MLCRNLRQQCRDEEGLDEEGLEDSDLQPHLEMSNTVHTFKRKYMRVPVLKKPGQQDWSRSSSAKLLQIGDPSRKLNSRATDVGFRVCLSSFDCSPMHCI